MEYIYGIPHTPLLHIIINLFCRIYIIHLLLAVSPHFNIQNDFIAHMHAQPHTA